MPALALLVSLAIGHAAPSNESVDCRPRLDQVLKIHGLKLPPLAESKSLTSIQKSISDANQAYANAKSISPPGTIDLDQAPRPKEYTKQGRLDLNAFTQAQREFDQFQMDVAKRYDENMAPHRPAVVRARQPLQDAEYARVTDRYEGKTIYPFDRIDEYGQTTKVRTYVKGSRVIGVVLVNGEARTGYNFDQNCELTRLTEGYVRTESSGIKQDISRATCEILPELKASLSTLPTKPRDYANACASIGATLADKICQCPQPSGPVIHGINPWAGTCSQVPPERALGERLRKLGTFTYSPQRSDIEAIVARCAQSESLWKTSPRSSPSTSGHDPSPDASK